MNLTFTPKARTKLSTLVQSLSSSPRYFNQMIGRAQMYMPFIEEAFKDAGIPSDLKYLAIQESSLQPSVVSSSDAVGFWQFKAPTGLEMGLRIDERIDERRHIFRASSAAAQYLKKANRDYDNWVYAVIAYYEGPTGSVAYTDPAYYSQRSMLIDENCHWYVLKAIAHKLAYEAAIQEAPLADWYLVPYSTAGEVHLDALIAEHGISSTVFFQYNPWMLDHRRLPRSERPFTYYLPISGGSYAGHTPDPTKAPQEGVIQPPSPSTNLAELPLPSSEEEAVPDRVSPQPQPEPIPEPVRTNSFAAIPLTQLNASVYAGFPIESDLHYGIAYVHYTGEYSLPDLAILNDINYTDLLEWNGLQAGKEPKPGTVIYLSKLNKAPYHIVRPGETLAQIASLHGTTTRKLQKRNRMRPGNLIIFEGQKLSLRGKKPTGEKMIILLFPEQAEAPAPTTEVRDRRTPQVSAAELEIEPQPDPAISSISEPAEAQTLSKPPTPLEDEKRIWIEHTVMVGETLWQISQRYDTKVAIIQRINNLEDAVIHPGQVLHILVRQSILEEIAREASRSADDP